MTTPRQVHSAAQAAAESVGEDLATNNASLVTYSDKSVNKLKKIEKDVYAPIVVRTVTITLEYEG